ncbi:MAG: EF-hand domain-containing protein [Aliishimia sp.]
MNTTLKLTVLSVAILAGGFSVAYAQGKERPSFETLDTDGDGQITSAEMEARGAGRFALVDTNSDGGISLDELQATHAKRADDRAAKLMERLDTNGDKLLSAEEMSKSRRGGGAGRLFKTADADKNGAISKAEFDQAMLAHKGRHKK